MRQITTLIAIMIGLMGVVGVADAETHCAPGLESRSADQVLNDHFAAIRSGNVDRILCDYSHDAAILTPGSVVTTDEGIRGFYAQIFALMGGPGILGLTSLTVAPVNPSRSIALLEWTLDSSHLAVGDGTDTFVIVNGKIHQQTVKLGGFVMK
jgi:ketosteroid isomerase-like protein